MFEDLSIFVNSIRLVEQINWKAQWRLYFSGEVRLQQLNSFIYDNQPKPCQLQRIRAEHLHLKML